MAPLSNATTLVLAASLLASGAHAFTATSSSRRAFRGASHSLSARQPHISSSTLLFNKADDDENEIERLQSMAAKLRAEAAQLEAQQSQAMADAAERAFRKFDTNQDGEISLDELKAGLEKTFKIDLPEKRVKQLMEDFDNSGDGKLQLDEFVNVEKFRNRLDSLAREERSAARKAQEFAKKEEELAQFLAAQQELINDKPPSNADKALSVVPYLLPFLDSLQFAKFLILGNPDNVLSPILAVMYALFRAVPFGGLIAFFALSFLSGNTSINRLVRFNMQQAIYLDIALFFPGLLAAIVTLIAGGGENSVPPELAVLGSDATFAVMLLALVYACGSSLLGQTPNKIPLISDAVEARMPTIDMFDAQGRFNPPGRTDKEENDGKKD